MALFDSIRHLLPKGRVWALVVDRPLRRLVLGLTNAVDEVRLFVDDVRDDIDPQRTRDVPGWEREFGLSSAGTDAQRRSRLEATWADAGGQSPHYLQTTLRDAGHDVCLHEWWTTDTSPRTAYDPRDVAEDPLIGTNQCTSVLADQAQCLDTASATSSFVQPQCNTFLARFPKYYVNLTTRETVPPTIPFDADKWVHFLYLSGSRYVREVPALIDGVMRYEFERLLLKTKPAHTWAVANVEYLDQPGFLGESGSHRWTSFEFVEDGEVSEWTSTSGVTVSPPDGDDAPTVDADLLEGRPGLVYGSDARLSNLSETKVTQVFMGDPSIWSIALVFERPSSLRDLFEVRNEDGTQSIRVFQNGSGDISVWATHPDGNWSGTWPATESRPRSIVATYHGTGLAGPLNLYVDGVNVISTPKNFRLFTGLTQLWIGGDGAGEIPAFADVCIVPRVVTADEAQEHADYFLGLFSNAAESSDPVERWLSTSLDQGPVVSWDGENGVSTLTSGTLNQYPRQFPNIFGTLPAVIFEPNDTIADAAAAAEITDALGSSFSVGFFGRFSPDDSGIVIGDANVLVAFSEDDGQALVIRSSGDPLVVSGLWDVLRREDPHAFVITYDRPTHTMRLVVDGQVIGSNTSGSASDVAVTEFGIENSSNGNVEISDVVFFDGALSEESAIAVSNAMARTNGACSLALVEDAMAVLDYNQIRAVSVRPPRMGEVYRVAVTATSKRFLLPGAADVNALPDWKSNYITMRPIGDDVQIQFGEAGESPSVTIDETTTETGSNPISLTANNAIGATIQNGEERSFRLSLENQFAVIAASNCTLEFWRSSHDPNAP